MSAAAVIRLGPIASAADLWRERFEPGRYYYYRDALRLPADGVPLCVDHDTEQRIGVVDELFEQQDGEGRSLYCRAVVFDRAQHWVGRGRGASVGFYEKDSIVLAGAAVLVTAGTIDEVTLTKGDQQPRERTAMVTEVTPIKRKWEPVAAPTETRPAARTPLAKRAILPTEPLAKRALELQRDELNRRITAALDANPHADVGAIIVGYKIEIGAMRVSGIDQAYAEFQRRRLAA